MSYIQNYYIRQGGYVFISFGLFVCLFVCLFVSSLTQSQPIFTKFGRMVLGPMGQERKKRFDFGGNPHCVTLRIWLLLGLALDLSPCLSMSHTLEHMSRDISDLIPQ